MNVNLSLGILSFILWSTFSTWYYVNFIKEFPEDESMVNRPIETPEIEKITGSDSLDAIDLKKTQSDDFRE